MKKSKTPSGINLEELQSAYQGAARRLKSASSRLAAAAREHDAATAAHAEASLALEEGAKAVLGRKAL